MKASLITKIVITNLLVLLFSLGVMLLLYDFINNDSKQILEQRKQISLFNKTIDSVAANLYKSSNLKENIYLAKSATASCNATEILDGLKSVGYKTSELEEIYREFFKNTVITTSYLMENRFEEARVADKISSANYEQLQTKLREMIVSIDKDEDKITKKLILLMFFSGAIFVILVAANMGYLIRSFRQLERKQKEIAESNAQRSTMIDAIGDGIYSVDSNGICTLINQSGADMLGFSVDEILGKNQHYLFHHHHIDESEYSVLDCPIHKTVQDRQKRICQEYFVSKTGEYIPVSVTVAPTGSDGAVVVFKDMTEAKEHEKELERRVAEKTYELSELNENLEQRVILEITKNKKQQEFMQQQSRLAALGEMIGNIAHQWRQPLSAITTSVSGLKIKQEFGLGVSEEDIIETSDLVIKSANYLSQTIDDFRNFIKNDNVKEEFLVVDVINKAIDIVRVILKANDVSLQMKLDEEVVCNGYANELAQVIINIMNNAKDAYVEHNIEIREIYISLEAVDKMVVLKISDIAGGIPEHIKEKIFDPYFTTKHQSQGTGLGLYMSANIIRDHFKGKIFITDNYKTIDGVEIKGTTFTIELPK